MVLLPHNYEGITSTLLRLGIRRGKGVRLSMPLPKISARL